MCWLIVPALLLLVLLLLLLRLFSQRCQRAMPATAPLRRRCVAAAAAAATDVKHSSARARERGRAKETCKKSERAQEIITTNENKRCGDVLISNVTNQTRAAAAQSAIFARAKVSPVWQRAVVVVVVIVFALSHKKKKKKNN